MCGNGWYMLSGRISERVPVRRTRNCDARIRSWHTTEPRPAICTVLPQVFCFLSLYEYLIFQVLINYSYLNASIGFLVAARQLCKLTVNKTIAKANTPDRAKIHQFKLVLYAKFSSHLLIV